MSLEPLAIGVIVGGSDPLVGIEKVRNLGLTNCQLSVPGADWRTRDRTDAIRSALTKAAVTVTCVFSGYPGESYADIPTVQKTVGLVPEATREDRLRMTLEHSDFARDIGAPALAAHIGFVPEDQDDSQYSKVVEAVRGVCDRCETNGLKFALETGQETAPTLARFIRDVDRPNLGVNFDPANMMMYGSGDPIEALDHVGQWLVGVHCKDGDYPTAPGQLGVEYPLGKGKVGFPRFIEKLKEIGYNGPLTIEREISGVQQLQDIRAAVNLLEDLRG